MKTIRVAMLLHKSVEHDSRVRREARALAEAGHEVTVLHLPRRRGELDGELEGFRVRSVTPPAWTRLLPGSVARLVSMLFFVRSLRGLRPDVVHAHDAAMLVPARLSLLRRGRLVYDSHELATGVPYRERLWAFLVAAIERAVVPRCDLVITVSDGIAARLASRYRLRRAPVVVRNFPDPRAYVEGVAPDLRAELDLAAGTRLALHLGSAAEHRGCGVLVAAISRLPADVHLLFLGADLTRALALADLAERRGVGPRVHFMPALPIAGVLPAASQASVGVSLLEETCDNHRLALPNKVFEYLAAGTPVVAADLPELRRTLGGRSGAVLADPADEASVAAAIEAAIAGDRPARSGDFLWPDEAEGLVAAYEGLDDAAAGGEEKRAAILVRNSVAHDARIQRQAGLLSSMGFETTIVGVVDGSAAAGHGESIAGAEVLRLDPGSGLRGLARGLRARRRQAPRPRGAAAQDPPAAAPVAGRTIAARLRRVLSAADFYRRGIAVVRDLRPDLIHANDYNTAWIGVAGKWLTGARLVYDSHELWPDRNLRPEARPWLLLCESVFVRAADEVITTSPGYSQVMADRYRISSPRVVRNVPDWAVDSEPRQVGEEPLAVYFGAITRNRGLATALRALALVPRLRMRFIGPEAWDYRGELAALAERLGVASRLELLAPVPPDRAGTVMADADLGLALIEPACLSYEMTLPNKLYEYVAAGLPVLAGDVPILAAEVRAHGIGTVADPSDPEAVAAAIESILDPAANSRFRDAASVLGREANWSRERESLAELYVSLSGGAVRGSAE